MKAPAHKESPICRRKRTAEILDCCESQVVKFESKGLLKAIRVEGVRAVWNDLDEVHRLAENIRRGKLSSDPAA